MASVEIKGLQALTERLQRLGRDTDAIVDNSLNQSAEQIRKQAQINIQNMSVSYNGAIYDAKETGQLMREQHVERLGSCRYAVGTFVEYAPYVEFGTGSAGDPIVPHTARTKWTYYDDILGGFRTAYPRPPCPFLRPAFETYRNRVAKDIYAALLKAVNNNG